MQYGSQAWKAGFSKFVAVFIRVAPDFEKTIFKLRSFS